MFSLLLAPAAVAAPAPGPCADLTPIEQIKAFVACQGSTALAACGGLGGTVAGYAASTYLQRRYLRLMEAAHDALTHDLAEAVRDDDRAARRLLDPQTRLAQLDDELKNTRKYDDARKAFHEASKLEKAFYDPENTTHTPADFDRLMAEKQPINDELRRLGKDQSNLPLASGERMRARQALAAAIKRNPKGPVFEPLMRRLPFDDLQRFDVANLPFDELPEYFRVDYEQRAKTTAALIRQRLKDGLPLDDVFVERAAREVHAAWLKEARKRPRDLSLDMSDDALLKHELEAAQRVVRKAVDGLKAAETSILAKGLGPAMRLARKLGRLGPLAAGGIVAFTVYGVGQIADAKSTACASAHSPYVNEDPGHNCAFTCEVNENVADFLMKTPEDQRDIFARVPGVCPFYQKLHQCFFARPKFEGLACQSVGGGRTRLTLKARDEAKLPREYRVDVRDDGSVSAIGVYNAGGLKTRLFNFANADEQLTTRLGADSGAARELRQLKLFIPEAVECCRDRGETCAAQFGSVSASSHADDATSAH